VVVAGFIPAPPPGAVLSASSTDPRWRFMFSGILVWVDLKGEDNTVKVCIGRCIGMYWQCIGGCIGRLWQYYCMAQYRT